MRTHWNILIVDDEEDVHDVTRLGLKRKNWRNRAFHLVHAYSAEQAMQTLVDHDPEHFEVGIIDVIMETDDAGLRLCQHIREHLPLSFRIVLRTGQPGVAPEEQVMNEYDIDHYLPKTEDSPAELFSRIRACLRSSEDIATLNAYARQIRSYVTTSPSQGLDKELGTLMFDSIDFLDHKHGTSSLFVHDLEEARHVASKYFEHAAIDAERVMKEVQALRRRNKSGSHLECSESEDLDGLNVIYYSAQCLRDPSRAGMAEEGTHEVALAYLSPRTSEWRNTAYARDAAMFVDNWRIAYETICLRERLERERLLRERMYSDRLRSMTRMVAGVAHELNTPIGIAVTSNAMIKNLAQELVKNLDDPDQRSEIVRDLVDSCDLQTKSIARAEELIRSFKQLSANQMSDTYGDFDLGVILRECVEFVGRDLDERRIEVKTIQKDDICNWKGSASLMTRAVVHLLQNIILYAYAETGGAVDLRLYVDNEDNDQYVIEVEDYGQGIAEELLPRIFDLFVTTGRKDRRAGLGLCICHNIIVDLFGGKIKCDSAVGKGTRFTIKVPMVVDEERIATEMDDHCTG